MHGYYGAAGAERIEMNGWSAWLTVESTSYSLAELEERIGRASDGGHSIGDKKIPEVGPRAEPNWSNSEWRYSLESDDEESFGVVGLPRAISALKPSLVESIVSLEGECAVNLIVLQYIDELELLGIYLSPEALAVLARLKAEVNIEQYHD